MELFFVDLHGFTGFWRSPKILRSDNWKRLGPSWFYKRFRLVDMGGRKQPLKLATGGGRRAPCARHKDRTLCYLRRSRLGDDHLGSNLFFFWGRRLRVEVR